MTLALVKPGGWDPEDPLTSDEMNELQSELVKGVDGVGGGTYELADDLVFDGPGVVSIAYELQIQADAILDVDGTIELGGQTDITGQVDVLNGADINVKTGGEINLQGTGKLDVEATATINVEGFVRVKSTGGAIDVEIGAALGISGTASVFGDVDVKSGGDIDVEASGRINVLNNGKILGSSGAEIQLFDADDLTINNSTFAFRLALRPSSIEDVAGVPAFAAYLGAAPVWLQHDVADARAICFALPLRPGDTLTTLRLTLRGQAGISGHALVPATKPRLQLIQLDLDGGITLVQSTTDPVGTPGGSAAAYNLSHTITMSGGLLPLVLSASTLYVVRVLGETGTDSEADKTIFTAIDGTGIARSYRGPNEVYG